MSEEFSTTCRWSSVIDVSVSLEEEARVRRDQLDAVGSQARLALPGNIAGIVLYAAVLWPAAYHGRVIAWLLAMVVGLTTHWLVVAVLTRELANVP